MSQEGAVCNLYEWVLSLRSFPSCRFRPFSSSLLSFLFLSSCLPPSLAAFENKNVKRYNVNALSKIKNVTM